MSCSVIIKDGEERDRRVYVDSEEELKYMTVEELLRRVCPDDERRRRSLHFLFKEMEDDQTGLSEITNYDRTLGYYGITKGSTVFVLEIPCDVPAAAPLADENEDEGFSER